MLVDFLVILIFVFILSGLVMTLGVKPPPSPIQEASADDSPYSDQLNPDDFDSLVETIEQDTNLLKPTPPITAPHINLPGAKIGGGAADENCSKATAAISFFLNEDPSEQRKYNRRMNDRRTANQPVEHERRLVQRRVWLRREEDRKGMTLLNITDAADTLGVTIEQIYKWLDNSNIPFYQVTEGKRKAIRFEINELLHWHGQFVRRTDGRQ